MRSGLPLQSCLNNNFMIEQFNFDIYIQMVKVSAAIFLYRNFRQNGLKSVRTMDLLIFLCYKQELLQL